MRHLLRDLSIGLAALALATAASAAAAAECGPDKLGTSRVAEVGTKGGLLIGLKTYPAAIPLADHEVILTFDDGPDERTTPLVLKALADQCVRATFFAIGRKLDEQPALARSSGISSRPRSSSPCSPHRSWAWSSDSGSWS